MVLHKRIAINSMNVKSIKKRKHNKTNCLTVGTWNVCTLVESTGDERVCRKRVVKACNDRNDPSVVDRKLDLVVRELKRYGVSCRYPSPNGLVVMYGMWASTYSYILAVHCHMLMRNEGVGIALDKVATEAWRSAEVWEAVSSRMVMARLMWSGLGRRK